MKDSSIITSSSPSEAIPITENSKDFINNFFALIETWPNRPSWDSYFMAMAALIASRSACNRLHVGCVLVSAGAQPYRLIAAGYNGFLTGQPHISRVRDDHELGTVHAEQNAITDAARRGVSVDGAIAYITHFPCVHCAKILLAAGIQAIKYHHDYKNDPIVYELLVEANVRIEQI